MHDYHGRAGSGSASTPDVNQDFAQSSRDLMPSQCRCCHTLTDSRRKASYGAKMVTVIERCETIILKAFNQLRPTHTMPIYEYYCLKCGKNFELLLRGDDQPRCPDCETTKIERRMSVPARLGGTGESRDFSSLGPPSGSTGGCGGGSCGCH